LTSFSKPQISALISSLTSAAEQHERVVEVEPIGESPERFEAELSACLPKAEVD
jgi:hypothetical protein